jgi:hypothetical protein
MDRSNLICGNGNGSLCPAATQPSQLARDHQEHETSSSSRPVPQTRGRGVLLWGMGGTLLSALGFIGLALFEQYNSMLVELRNDLKHFNETAVEFAKKDSLQRLRDQLKERFKELDQSNGVREHLGAELRASEKAREEMGHELQRMRERLAFLEGRLAAVPGVPPPPVPEGR